MMKDSGKFFLIILLALILGVLVDYLFYGKPIGVSFFFFVSIFLIFSLFLTKKFNQKLKRGQILIAISLLLLSAGIFLNMTFFLRFFNFLASFYFLFLFLNLFSEKQLSGFSFQKYLIFPFSFVQQSVRKATSFLRKFWELVAVERKLSSPEFLSLIKGVIIALPILALFIWLLASADIVFQKYVDSLLKIFIDLEIVLRTLIVLAASYFFVGLFAQIFAEKKEESLLSEDKKFDFLGPIESSVILGLVGFLFLIFILIQFVYLFGGIEYVWGIGVYITYAEYARRGFGELILVSFIFFFLIYGIDKLGKRESIFQKRIFKILTSVLILQLFVIMASAHKRLSLYIDAYGFTFARILGLTFLLWLFLIFLFFLFKIICEKKETLFLSSAFWLTVAFLVGLNIFNPDAFIARKNIERHLQGKELDVQYLSWLSEDALPEIIRIFEMDEVDDEIKMDVVGNLKRKLGYQNYYLLREREEIMPFDEKVERIKAHQEWQSFNLSRHRALTVLARYSEKIKEYQIKYWKREEAKCREWLRECEERCERKFAEEPEEIIRCKETECGCLRRQWERYKENLQRLLSEPLISAADVIFQ